MKIKVEYFSLRRCWPILTWLAWIYWGVNKWGDREWAVRLFGLTLYNEIEHV